MKISVSLSTQAESGEQGVEYQNVAFNLGGFDPKEDIRPLGKLFADWMSKKITENLDKKINDSK